MRRYLQLSVQTEIKRATHPTIYNGSESPGFGIISRCVKSSSRICNRLIYLIC
ncbi:MAG: hypothetical protein HC789_17025 [Microcoleus sp. CSU_2_2]|nr:hypothetical protein [Microcoleus sp. CSU_2_2]